MEVATKMGLGVGAEAGNPAKIVLVMDDIASDAREVLMRFGIDENSREGSPTLIFPTMETALSAVNANKGDKIFIAPGHTETLSAANAIDNDVAGVEVIALGVGNNRATFTFTNTAAEFVIGASNLKFKNIIFVNDVDSLVEPIEFQANIDNVDFVGCSFRDATAAKQTLRWFQTADTNDRIRFIDCEHEGSDTAGAVAWGTFIGGSKHAVIGLKSNGDFSAANIEIKTTLTSDLLIDRCTLENANAVDVNIEGNSLSNTGWIKNTHCRLATNGQTTWINNIGGITIYNSFGADNSGEAGQRIGTANTGSIEDDVNEILTDTGTTLPATLATIVTSTGTTIPALHAVPAAEAATNVNARDVLGNKEDNPTFSVGTTKSLMAYVKGVISIQEGVAVTAPAVMVDNNVLFTIAGGPIMIIGLWSECVTGNDATASTLVYKCTPTSGSEQTISGASASLANAAIGASVSLAGTALATAALLNANGPNLIANPGTIVAPAGTIGIDVAVGSTTGTWAHYLRYKPLSPGVTVT